MYEEFYGLKEKPFNLTPDPNYLYMGSRQREAIDFLSSEIRKKRTGLIVLSGEIGSGKTILLRSFLKDIGPSYELIQVFYPTNDCTQLLQMILLNMGVKSVKGDFSALHEELKNRLIELHRKKKNLLLVIDEAQHLGKDAIKETFRLSGLKDNDQLFLKVILCGLPKLQKKVSSLHMMDLQDDAAAHQDHDNVSTSDNGDLHSDAAVFQELHDKVSSLQNTDKDDINTDTDPQVDISTYHLEYLPAKDIPAYIDYRMNAAGCSGCEIFPEEVINGIGRYSGGTPRLIDMICDSALVKGYKLKEKIVSLSTLQEVIDRQFRDLVTEDTAGIKMPSASAPAADNGEADVSEAEEEPIKETLPPEAIVNAEETDEEQPAAQDIRTVIYEQPELRVLILEKNARIKVHLENSFQKNGYDSHTVNNIEELIETLEHSEDRDFHILVLDAGFFFKEGGREDAVGRSALDRIKTSYAHLPLIMISALPLSSMRARLSEMGIPYLLHKPDVSRVDLSRIASQFNNYFEELRSTIDNINARFSAFYQRFIK